MQKRLLGAVLCVLLWSVAVGAITPNGQGQVLWCDVQRGLWGYTLRAFPGDNIMYFSYDGPKAYLGYPVWVNGLYVNSTVLLDWSSTAVNFGATGYDPVTNNFIAQYLDNTVAVTLTNAANPIVSCCPDAATVGTIERGPDANNPAAYPNGVSAITPGALYYQAGQLQSLYPPTNEAPPPVPPPPVQALSTLIAHVGQFSDSPQPAMNGVNFAMKNKSLVELKVNGLSGVVQVAKDAPFTLTAEVHPGACLGQPVEYWLGSINRNLGGHIWWYHPDGTWQKHDNPVSVGIAALQDIAPMTILQGPLAIGYTGTWDFYGGADFGATNGSMGNPLIAGSVRVIVQ